MSLFVRSTVATTRVISSSAPRSTIFSPRALKGLPAASNKLFHGTSIRTDRNKSVTVLETSLIPRLPESSATLFEAKQAKNLTFAEIGEAIGRNEVAVAALFYGQARASREDIDALASLLSIPKEKLAKQLAGWPERGNSIPMPPKDPLIYRLYEIVQNYGLAYKGVLNEKFGDGIMSAISFSTKVEKEVDEQGTWAKITLRGKWLPYSRF